MSYKQRYEAMKAQLRRQGTEVVEDKDGALLDFEGMNPEAARVFGFPDKSNVIIIGKGSAEKKLRTLLHETVEDTRMKEGMPYWPAHKIALKAERAIK